jgi:hypothetical protein
VSPASVLPAVPELRLLVLMAAFGRMIEVRGRLADVSRSEPWRYCGTAGCLTMRGAALLLMQFGYGGAAGCLVLQSVGKARATIRGRPITDGDVREAITVVRNTAQTDTFGEECDTLM